MGPSRSPVYMVQSPTSWPQEQGTFLQGHSRGTFPGSARGLSPSLGSTSKPGFSWKNTSFSGPSFKCYLNQYTSWFFFLATFSINSKHQKLYYNIYRFDTVLYPPQKKSLSRFSAKCPFRIQSWLREMAFTFPTCFPLSYSERLQTYMFLSNRITSKYQ